LSHATAEGTATIDLVKTASALAVCLTGVFTAATGQKENYEKLS
jgi:hypothetical protein